MAKLQEAAKKKELEMKERKQGNAIAMTAMGRAKLEEQNKRRSTLKDWMTPEQIK